MKNSMIVVAKDIDTSGILSTPNEKGINTGSVLRLIGGETKCQFGTDPVSTPNEKGINTGSVLRLIGGETKCQFGTGFGSRIDILETINTV